MSLGERISPILIEIENTLWEFEANTNIKPGYSHEGFRAACKILMSSLLDKMWELQESENMSIEDKFKMAQKAGEDFRQLIKNYTNLDTQDMYNPNKK